jgi:hypothetical protein
LAGQQLASRDPDQLDSDAPGLRALIRLTAGLPVGEPDRRWEEPRLFEHTESRIRGQVGQDLELGDEPRMKFCVKPTSQWTRCLLGDLSLLSFNLASECLE